MNGPTVQLVGVTAEPSGGGFRVAVAQPSVVAPMRLVTDAVGATWDVDHGGDATAAAWAALRAAALGALAASPQLFRSPPAPITLERLAAAVWPPRCSLPPVPDVPAAANASAWEVTLALTALIVSRAAINPVLEVRAVKPLVSPPPIDLAWEDHATAERAAPDDPSDRVITVGSAPEPPVTASVDTPVHVQAQVQDEAPAPVRAPPVEQRHGKRSAALRKAVAKERVKEAYVRAHLAVRAARREERRFLQHYALADNESTFSEYDRDTDDEGDRDTDAGNNDDDAAADDDDDEAFARDQRIDH